MATNKGSDVVVQFMAFFARLKDWIDDDPEYLSKAASEDESISNLCGELYQVAHRLKVNERGTKDLFTGPVDPKFLAAWRDFENRYEYKLLSICLPFGTGGTSRDDYFWSNAELNADMAAYFIEFMFEYASIESNGDDREFSDDTSISSLSVEEHVDIAIRYWESLKNEAGLDLPGAFRRRNLIPFVLVPRHVAARHGDDEKLSFYENLRQAHGAFIFGAPYAALALMRSIMEAVLRDHYGAPGKDIHELINNARGLPDGANAAALHRLRKRANAILHLNAEKDAGRSTEAAEMEREIISLLFVLRALIENAPQRQSP